MADISLLGRLVDNIQRNVDVSQNALVVGSLKVGSVSPTELTKAILDNLLLLQNGSDISASLHHHDNRYFTETEVGSSTSSSGSDLVGDDNTYSNFTPAAATVKGALSGIDAALAATADEKVGVSATDTTPGYLDEKVSVDVGSNASTALEATVQGGGGDETYRIRLDQSKIDHGSLAGLGDDDHTIYTKADGTRAFSGNQSFGGFKATNLADPTANGDAVNLSYLNARIAGVKPKTAARAASLADVDISSELENGDTLDGVTLATGDRVLLKDQAAPEENGIYIVAASGAASRATDFDSVTPIDEINGAWLAIQEGSQAGQIFVQFGSVVDVGTDPIDFEYWNPIAGLIGGDMITFSGSTFSVDLASDAGLESSNPGDPSGQLRVKLDGSTLSRSSSGLKVAALGITNSEISASAGIVYTKLALTNSIVNADVAAGAAIAYTKLNLSNSIVAADLTSDSVTTAKILNANVTKDKLASDVADQDSITGGAGSSLVAQHAKAVQSVMVAGEAFAADETFLVRMAVDGETAGRVYKADLDASSDDLFYVIGWARSVAGASAGNPVVVYEMGSINLGANDTPFASSDIGKPIFLDAAGAFSLAPSTASNMASVRVGVVENVSRVKVQQMQLNGIN